MKGIILLVSVITQLIVLIKVAAGYGLTAGVLCLLGLMANGITCAAVYSPEATENDSENDNEQE